jgi:hypothetical protein
MTEANLAIVRKVVLWAGLLVSALLFVYPHWRLSVEPGDGRPAVAYNIGRAFIMSPPLPGLGASFQLATSSRPGAGYRQFHSTTDDRPVIEARRVPLTTDDRPGLRIHYVRQFTEVALALAFTFGLMLALRKPAGDTTP